MVEQWMPRTVYVSCKHRLYTATCCTLPAGDYTLPVPGGLEQHSNYIVGIIQAAIHRSQFVAAELPQMSHSSSSSGWLAAQLNYSRATAQYQRTTLVSCDFMLLLCPPGSLIIPARAITSPQRRPAALINITDTCHSISSNQSVLGHCVAGPQQLVVRMSLIILSHVSDRNRRFFGGWWRLVECCCLDLCTN